MVYLFDGFLLINKKEAKRIQKIKNFKSSSMLDLIVSNNKYIGNIFNLKVIIAEDILINQLTGSKNQDVKN